MTRDYARRICRHTDTPVAYGYCADCGHPMVYCPRCEIGAVICDDCGRERTRAALAKVEQGPVWTTITFDED